MAQLLLRRVSAAGARVSVAAGAGRRGAPRRRRVARVAGEQGAARVALVQRRGAESARRGRVSCRCRLSCLTTASGAWLERSWALSPLRHGTMMLAPTAQGREIRRRSELGIPSLESRDWQMSGAQSRGPSIRSVPDKTCQSCQIDLPRYVPYGGGKPRLSKPGHASSPHPKSQGRRESSPKWAIRGAMIIARVCETMSFIFTFLFLMP